MFMETGILIFDPIPRAGIAMSGHEGALPRDGN